MAKKILESMAMSDEDEFFETSSSEEGGNDDSDSDGSEGSDESGTDDDGGDSGEGDNGSDSGTEGGTDENGEEGGEGGSGADGSGDDTEGENEDTGGKGSSAEGGEKKGDAGNEAASGKGDEGSGSSDEEEDLFGDLGDESGENDKGSTAVNFKKIGEKLEIELEEDTEEEFTKKVNKKIEDAKQQVDVSKFKPEAQRLIKHLNDNDGELGDFFVNPVISSYQNVLSMSAEEKLKMVRRPELLKSGSTPEEVETKLDSEIKSLSAEQIMKAAQQIDLNAQNLINAEIEEIVGSKDKIVQQTQAEKKQQEKERVESLKNYVHQQDQFLGLKLTEKAKTGIIRDIETGNFDKIADMTDAEARLAAYLIKRQGKKIMERFAVALTEKGREAYNEALSKTTSKLHKTADEAKGKKTGHTEDHSGEKKNFDNWASIE